MFDSIRQLCLANSKSAVEKPNSNVTLQLVDEDTNTDENMNHTRQRVVPPPPVANIEDQRKDADRLQIL